MADNTLIEWADATVNAVNGCSVVSPGCTNCYAMRLAGTRMRNHATRAGLTVESKAGPVWNGEVRLHEPALIQPLRWARPRRIFWNAHGDLLHPAVPDAWIDRVFAACALTPQHIHMILTKRSARMLAYACDPLSQGRILDAMDGLTRRGSSAWPGWPLPNVWLGVSVEDQARSARIDVLRATPAAVRFVSFEPLLGLVDADLTGIHWAIVGGESGPGARPMHPDWARGLRDQCVAAGVAFHFKQWGEWAPLLEISEDVLEACYGDPVPRGDPEGRRPCRVEHLVMQANGRTFPMDGWSRLSGDDPKNGDFAFAAGSGAMTMMKVGKKAAGRLLDGREWNEVPA